MALGGPPPGDPPNQPGELQFERAEYAGGASGPSCSNCQQSAPPQYYELNGKIFCEICRQRIEQSIQNLHQSGNLGRAFLYGLGAAFVGSLIYYAASAITGYTFGLIAIVVGLLVGKAVRKGSGSLGGWRYQALAMLLTYLSIVSSYVPDITRGMEKVAAEQQKIEAEARAKLPPGTPAPSSTVAPPNNVIRSVLVYMIAFALAFVLPVISGFHNPLGLIIIAFGIWEAWKFNRRVEVKFTGPFSGAGAQPAPGTP